MVAEAISGGINNQSSGYASFVGGGLFNYSNSGYSGILGGRCNCTCSFNDVMISGSQICANRACTTFVNKLSAMNFDECASVGALPSGSFYYDAATCLVLFKP